MPEPIDMVRTSWSTDPYSAGSYSFLAVGASPQHRAALAEPIGDRLFFAGKATDLDNPSTVHGALASGRRAAAAIVERAERLGATTAPFDYRQTALRSGRPGNRRVTDPDVLSAAAFDEIGRALERAGEHDDVVSIADVLASLRADDPGDIDDATLDWALTSEIATEYGAAADELSAHWGLEEGSDDDDLLVIGGYQQLAIALAGRLDIELQRPVRMIGTTSGGVTVTTDDGGLVNAGRIVVTVPLGVLQAQSIEFRPPLPDLTTDAIDSLGMGLLDKLWFRFDQVFWRDDALMWTWVDPGDNPFTEWFNLEPVTNEPILLALAGAAIARDVAARSNAEVIEFARAALQAFVDAQPS